MTYEDAKPIADEIIEGTPQSFDTTQEVVDRLLCEIAYLNAKVIAAEAGVRLP